MVGIFLILRRLARAFRKAWSDETFRAATISLVTLLTIATVFYSLVEGWSVVDSLYFTVVTGLTIGYGDLTPQEPISKIFTVIYALLAVGLFVALATSIAQASVGRRLPKRGSLDGGDDAEQD